MAEVDVWEIALAFMDSQALLAADELQLFDALERAPATAAELAGRIGVPTDSADRLLIALTGLELLDRHPDGRYGNRAAASERLVRQSPGYVGAMFEHVRNVLYPAWGHCRAALQSGHARWDLAFPDSPPPLERMYQDAEALQAFMAGMHGITHAPALQFAAAAPELRGLRSLVDVGGASGAFALALAQTLPALHALVFDLPAVGPIAEQWIRSAGLDGRVRFVPGDFWSDPLPAGADAYALGFIIHDWHDAGADLIMNKVLEAARPDSLIILGEFLLDDRRTGPRFVARQNLNMLVTARGRERSAAEYAEWLRSFRLELEAIYPTAGGKAYMLARRPGPATGERERLSIGRDPLHAPSPDSPRGRAG